MRTIRTKIKKATSTPKGRIIFFSLLLVIVAAIGGGVLYWGYYRKQIIREKLESTIHEKSKGLYSIKYDELKLDEVAGYLSVQNLQLSYDSLRYASLLKQQDAPPSLLRINIPEIIVSGVKTPRALIDKEIVGRKVEIRNAVIDIVYTNAGKDSSRSTPTKEVYEQILGNLNLIKIDTLLITNATITTRDLASMKKKVQLLNTDISLFGVAVDSTADADTTRLLYSEEVRLNCGKVTWKSPDNRYNYSVDSFSLHSANNNVRIKKFSVDPTMDENAFTRSLRFADDRFDINVRGIDIRNIDLRSLFNEEVNADTIFINTASLKIYRDISLQRDNKSRIGTYPHQSVAKISIPVHVKAMILSNSFVEYKERNPKTRLAGKVQFYSVSASITNITNRKELVKENNLMIVDTRSRFLNKAPLRATWKFYLFNPKGKFDLSGSLGTIDATQVNVLTEPMGPARIEKGTINRLDFNFTGHDYGMNGSVKMLYNDLKVAILEKEEDTRNLKKKKLASMAANLIIRNSNPQGRKDEVRVIQVDFERDTQRSMFHMIWKSIFKGVKETAGIKK